MLSWGLVGGAFPVNVSTSASSAFGDDILIAYINNIGNDFVCLVVSYFGSGGHMNYQVLAVFAVHLFASAMAAVFGSLVRSIVNSYKRRFVGVSFENDVSTVAPVAPVRASMRNELFTAKAYASVSAISGFCV
jgi:hypothetical protein